MAFNLEKFGACNVKNIVDKSSVMVSTFWQEKPCIIALLRRFGCQLCRLECLELSRFKKVLDEKNVRLIAIGHDAKGVDEFQKGNFFNGELYLDEDKQTYSSLGLSSVNAFSGMMSLFKSDALSLIKETRDKNVKGNFTGDGWQLGGLLVVDKDGKTMYTFKQEKVADKPNYDKIRECFGIKEEELTPFKVEQPKAECH